MHLSYPRMAKFSVAGCAAWVLAAVPVLLHLPASGQVPDSAGGQSSSLPSGASLLTPSDSDAGTPAGLESNDSGESHRSGRWFEPRITVQHTVTSNARLNSTGSSDQVTEVMPGFNFMRNTARVKGFVDYSLRAAHYARGTRPDKVWHNLNARGTLEAVEDRLFIDVDGMMGLQSTSAFGPTGNTLANPNMVRTSNFRISPYVKGRFGGDIDYEARYGIQNVRSDTLSYANAKIHDWLFHLGKRPAGHIFGWGVDATQQDTDYSTGRSIDTTALRGRLIYLPNPQLLITGIAGIESTNQLSPTKESHNIVGLGIDWRPSDRTHIFFERESRYFGESHNANLEYRTSRTVWRYTDRRDVMSGLGVQSASMGSLFDLLDGFYTQTEPNPIRRMQLVQAELARMGLPADMQVFQDFLSSSSRLQRLQQLSLGLLGRRSTLTLALSRSDTRQMDGSLQLGDDFQNNRRIRRRGWSVMLGHRLTQNSTINTTFSDTRSIGSTLGWETRIRTLMFGLNTKIAPRTNLGLQLRRVLSDGNMNKYDESAVMGFITHRF